MRLRGTALTEVDVSAHKRTSRTGTHSPDTVMHATSCLLGEPINGGKGGNRRAELQREYSQRLSRNLRQKSQCEIRH